MGVVSLLGIEQAHRIFELVKEEIPAEEIVERQITVGDARTFQGKERDIMFLSMVATPDQKTTSTAQMFEQRFNVAASRARDRMYLFRSVELRHLNKHDLKAKLIEHFQTPFHQDPVRVASLRELCESDFEREMFDVLTNAGFRVKPQVQVGGYRIDMVVEGHEDRRLAVECDGDKYHGPEQWSHDMARQRILERAGWAFWRCFGSSFNRDRKGTLADLWETLRKMGIEPIGAAEVDLGRYTEHREVSPFGGADDGEDTDDPAGMGAGSGELVHSVSGTAGRAPEMIPIEVQYPIGSSAIAQQLQTERRVAEPDLPGERPRPVVTLQTADTDQRLPGHQEPGVVHAGIIGGEPNAKLTDAVLKEFVRQHFLRSVDHRPKGGAFWITGHITREASTQLKRWGFQFAPSKGWWKK